MVVQVRRRLEREQLQWKWKEVWIGIYLGSRDNRTVGPRRVIKGSWL